jgi:hypothetical protein
MFISEIYSNKHTSRKETRCTENKYFNIFSYNLDNFPRFRIEQFSFIKDNFTLF